MMKKSEQLHELIHSLTKSEKRYFKLNNSKKNSIYLKIYDAILEQQQYDPIPLQLLLQQEKIQSSLARIQHHLYQLLLKSLAAFHSTQHPKYEVLDAMKHYIILRDRGLRVQGQAILAKALIVAQANNYYGLVLEIMDLMEDWITEEDSYDKAFRQQQKMLVLHQEQMVYNQEILNLKELVFGLRLFYLEHQFARNKEQKMQLLDYIKVYEKAIGEEQNLLKKRLLLTICIYAYYGLQDYNKLIKTENQRLDLLHQNWSSAHISPFLVYAFHRNLLWLLLHNKKYQEHQLLANKIDQVLGLVLLSKASFYHIKLRLAKEISLLYAALEQRYYDQAYQLMPNLWKLYEGNKHQWDSNLLVNTLILFIKTTFSLGKYEESLHWLHLLEHDVPQSDLLPYQNIGKIVHLLIHDGLGNKHYVQNALESTRIRLYRNQHFFEIANIFLNFLKRQVKTASLFQQKKLLLQYKKQLEEIAIKEEQKGFFMLFDFVDWFDSKLQNCSIAALNKGMFIE